MHCDDINLGVLRRNMAEGFFYTRLGQLSRDRQQGVRRMILAKLSHKRDLFGGDA